MDSLGIRRGMKVLHMSLRENAYFGVGYLAGSYAMRLIRLLVMLMLWRALFAGGADLGGMTLSQTLCYTVVSSALLHVLDVRTPASDWLHDGTILGLYQRPMGIFSQLALMTVGKWGMPLLLYGLPVLLGAGLLGLPLLPVTPWVWPSLLLCITQGFAVDFFFACVTVRAQNLSWQVTYLRGALTALLTGAVIPFAALPWGLGNILAYSPLGTLAGAPLSLWVGTAAPFPLLWAQVFWNVTLWPLVLWFFRSSRERMVSYGG